MNVSGPRRALACMLSALLLLSSVAPAAVYAEQSSVQLDNHAVQTSDTAVSGIRLDDVVEPRAGQPLDDTAKVVCEGGQTWEIPVLWVSNDLELATQAEEGRTYLPVLAYFVPQEFRVDGTSYAVTLSESLTKLFGGQEVISIYNEATGVTYILPASVRSLFDQARKRTVVGPENAAKADDFGQASEATPVNASEPLPGDSLSAEPDVIEGGEDTDHDAPGDKKPAARDLVSIYCAQTARDALSDEDLEYLIDLIINKLQPQAVNLLINRFPAFAEASRNGQLSTQIGLYVYFEKGDKDGHPEHEGASEALAYVQGDVFPTDDKSLAYCLLLAVDASSMVAKDANGNFIRKNGKCVLVKDGEAMDTLTNTIVHEMFHAFMDDYNRVGMLGARNVTEGYTPGGDFVSSEQRQIWTSLYFPKWFREGTASACENNWQFRHFFFKSLRSSSGDYTQYEDNYSRLTLLYNYIRGYDSRGNALYADLSYASWIENSTNARYATGYLAVLYLSELAARSNASVGTSIVTTETGVKVNSERLTLGLNDILVRMHNGTPLDQVIRDIAPKDGAGNPIYSGLEDFEAKFIKGTPDAEDIYYGDDASMEFTLTFLNYMRGLERNVAMKDFPNGSILYDFDADFVRPIDPNKVAEADNYRIIESNLATPSTVPNDVAFVGAGKSQPALTQAEAVSSEQEGETPVVELPLAAKQPAEKSTDGSSSEEPVADGDGDVAVADTVVEVPAADVAEPVEVPEPQEVPAA